MGDEGVATAGAAAGGGGTTDGTSAGGTRFEEGGGGGAKVGAPPVKPNCADASVDAKIDRTAQNPRATRRCAALGRPLARDIDIVFYRA